MRVQCLVICIDYDECDPLVYKCNKTKDVMPVNVCGCFFKQ